MLVLMLILSGLLSSADARLDFALATVEGPPVVPSGPPQVPEPPPNVPMPKVETKPEPLSYTAGATKAVHDGQPLVTFLGCRSRAIAGAITSKTETLPGYVAPAVVVAVPKNGELMSFTRSADATDAEIRATIAKLRATLAKAVQAQPSPFVPPPVGRDDDLSRGPWPTELPWINGMVRYRRARNTQSIFVLDGSGDVIRPVSRTQLDPKWQVSGGMAPFVGWRSDVYRSLPAPPKVWVGNIAVFNGSNYQDNRGWKREYADGSAFLDVLSVNDKVFEVRRLSKTGDHWEADVLYEDPEARPAGYNGRIGRSCASCHAGGQDNQPGSGGYAAGLLSGGDAIFSDPFPKLER